MSKPNTIQAILSTASCKLTRALLRRTGRGGTAVPGKVAMKFAGNILETTSEGMEIVVVTGTNGKTTTCSMIEHAVRAAGHDCLLNRSGAHLLSVQRVTRPRNVEAFLHGAHYTLLVASSARGFGGLLRIIHPLPSHDSG